MKLFITLIIFISTFFSINPIHANLLHLQNTYAVAEQLFKDKNYAKSNELFSDIINQAPNEAKAYLMRAQVLTYQGALTEALADLAMVKNLSTKFTNAVNHLYIRIGIQGNDYPSAIRSCKVLGPKYDETRILLTRLTDDIIKIQQLIVAKDFKQSLELCNEYLAKLEHTTLLHVFKATSLIETGEFKQAFISSNRAIQLNNRCANAYSLRGLLHQNTLDIDAAAKDFEYATQLAPNDSFCKIHKKNFEQFTDYFLDHARFFHLQEVNKIIKENRKDPKGYLYRAFVYRKNGQPQLESKDINRAQKLSKNAFYALLVKLGSDELRRSYIEPARFFLQHAITFAPQNQAAYLPYARILAYNNDISGAISYLDRALVINPNYSEAKQVRIQLLKLLKVKMEDIIAQSIAPYGVVEQVINPEGKGNLFLILQYHNDPTNNNLSITKEETSVPFVQKDIFHICERLSQSSNIGTIIVEGVGNYTWDGHEYVTRMTEGMEAIRTHYPHLNQEQLEDYLIYLNIYKTSGALLYEALHPDRFLVKGIADEEILARYFAGVEITNDQLFATRSYIQKRSFMYLSDALKASQELKSRDVAIVIGLAHKDDIIQSYKGKQKLYVIMPQSIYADPLTTETITDSEMTLLVEKEQFRELEELSARYIKQYPQLVIAYTYNAIANYQLYEFDKALQSAKIALTLAPKQINILAILADIYRSVGNYTKAKEYDALYAKTMAKIEAPDNVLKSLFSN